MYTTMDIKEVITRTEHTIPQDEYEIKQLAIEIGDDLVKQDITRDFTLCYWNEQTKEGAQSLHSTAEYVMKAIRRIEQLATKWTWNEKKKEWHEQQLSEKEQEKIKTIAKRTYDTYMNRIKFLSILNRNDEKNILVQWILEVGKEKKKEPNIDETLTNKVRNLISGEEKQ